MTALTDNHWLSLKSFHKYLKGIISYGLEFIKLEGSKEVSRSKNESEYRVIVIALIDSVSAKACSQTQSFMLGPRTLR